MDDLILHWQPMPGGARLLRVLGDTPCPVLPDAVEGFPILAVGRYCFAADAPLASDAHITRLGNPAAAQPLAGLFLESVRLPAPLQLLDSGAFYNCRKLKSITCGPDIRSLGSDVFTNCFALRLLDIHAEAHAPTGLKKLLVALTDDLQVRFVPDGAPAACLYYPSYYEWLDENTPAHIFNHSIEGEGYRYRQAFSGDAVNYREYDSAFQGALAEESPDNLLRIAQLRLRFPVDLAADFAAQYQRYLSANAKQAIHLWGKAKDTAALDFLARERCLDASALDAGIALATANGWAEGSALLADWKQRLFAPKKKTYDFDF